MQDAPAAYGPAAHLGRPGAAAHERRRARGAGASVPRRRHPSRAARRSDPQRPGRSCQESAARCRRGAPQRRRPRRPSTRGSSACPAPRACHSEALPTHRNRAAGAVDVTDVDLVACVPIALRERLLSGAPEPEHRPVTVAFVEAIRHRPDARRRWAGSAGDGPRRSRLGSAAGGPPARGLLPRVRRRLERREDPAGRGRSGHDRQRRGPRRSWRPAPRSSTTGRCRSGSGINRGRVFSGILGPPYRRTFSIKGDAVNLAARVMGRAAPGQVLATAAVLERARVQFASTPLEPFAVKGKSQLVEASIVGPVERLRDRRPRVAGANAADRARGRDGSRSTACWPTRDGARVASSTSSASPASASLAWSPRRTDMPPTSASWTSLCEAYEASTPYLAVRQLLLEALDLVDADGEETAARLTAATEAAAPELVPWLPLIGVVLGLELPPTLETAELGDAVRRTRLERTVSALLVRLLAGPVLVIVEDAHWMDEASGGVLRQLAARIRTEGWVLCMTRREDDAGVDPSGWPGTLTLRLGPLEAASIEAFIQASDPGLHLARHELAAVTERAGGNPLFLRELLLHAGAADAGDEVPDSVEAVIAAQIDRLPPRSPSASAGRLGARPDVLPGACPSGHRRRAGRAGRLGRPRRIPRNVRLAGGSVHACAAPGCRLRGTAVPATS